MLKAALHNLGCKVNAYETEAMQQQLEEHGYEIVPFDQQADVYIINTCSVTNIADRKSRQMLHRAKKMNPGAVVVAAGCYVQVAADALKEDGCVDVIIGNNRKSQLADILDEYLTNRLAAQEKCGAVQSETEKCGAAQRKTDQSESGQEKHGMEQHRAERYGAAQSRAVRSSTAQPVPEQPVPAQPAPAQPGTVHVLDIAHAQEYEEMHVSRLGEHTRAFIKVQDGCNQFCSYCIIPYARGRVRSRKQPDVVEEVKTLVARGYKEVVLTGIHLSSYGTEHMEGSPVKGGDWDCGPLWNLIESIHQIRGLERIRLGSLEPRIITEEFALRLAGLSKFCPHFHLSLQSGCDATLERMNRHYTTGDYLERCNILRRVFEHPAITTDVIAGFPGETEAEFSETLQFVEKVHFYEMHVFKYSRREGTRAAVMADQVPEPVKARRSDILLKLEQAMSGEYRQGFVGTRVSVLFEEITDIGGRPYLTGYTPQYVKAALLLESDAEGTADTDAEGTRGRRHAAGSGGKIQTGQIAELQATGLLNGQLLEVEFTQK